MKTPHVYFYANHEYKQIDINNFTSGCSYYENGNIWNLREALIKWNLGWNKPVYFSLETIPSKLLNEYKIITAPPGRKYKSWLT